MKNLNIIFLQVTIVPSLYSETQKNKAYQLDRLYFSKNYHYDIKFQKYEMNLKEFKANLKKSIKENYVKIKNSTLENMEFYRAKVYKETNENGVLIKLVNDYTTFLK